MPKRVGMKVVEHVTQVSHKGRRGSPRIPAGVTLYCIQYDLGGYFPYSYLNKAEAEFVIRAMIEHGTDTEEYYHFNLVHNREHTMHVGRIEEVPA